MYIIFNCSEHSQPGRAKEKIINLVEVFVWTYISVANKPIYNWRINQLTYPFPDLTFQGYSGILYPGYRAKITYIWNKSQLFNKRWWQTWSNITTEGIPLCWVCFLNKKSYLIKSILKQMGSTKCLYSGSSKCDKSNLN